MKKTTPSKIEKRELTLNVSTKIIVNANKITPPLSTNIYWTNETDEIFCFINFDLRKDLHIEDEISEIASGRRFPLKGYI